LGLSGLSSHLYYTEPSNFALVSLFKDGIFNKICNSDQSVLQKCNDVILVLSHLFNKKYLHSGLKKGTTTIRSPSKVFLDKLPSEAAEALNQFNQRALHVFSQYLVSFATHASLGKDNKLPFSGVLIEHKPFESPNGSLLDHLQKQAIRYKARSPFVAISGLGDTFRSIYELIYSVHREIYLDGNAVPIVEDVDWRGEPLEVNAYILDFYNHGQQKPLSVANGIREGDVWYLLKDFLLCLQTINTSLLKLQEETKKQDIKVKRQDEEEFKAVLQIFGIITQDFSDKIRAIAL